MGFHIRYISSAPQPRMYPTVYAAGPPETRLKAVSKEDISQKERLLRSSEEISTIIHGLNQSYIDNCDPSVLERVWATVETVFNCDPKPLLTKAEIDEIMAFVKRETTLKNDEVRRLKLFEALRSPDRMPNESRNERISRKISQLLGRDYDLTYGEIRKCTNLRGRYTHSVAGDWETINEATNYLRQILKEYLDLLVSKNVTG